MFQYFLNVELVVVSASKHNFIDHKEGIREFSMQQRPSFIIQPKEEPVFNVI